MNPKGRSIFHIGIAVTVLACIAFTAAMMLGIGTPRALASIVAFVLVIATLLLTLALNVPGKGERFTVHAIPALDERNRLNRQIRSSKVLIGFLFTALAFGLIQLPHAPLGPKIVGTIVTLVWIAALTVRVRQLRKRIAMQQAS